MNKNIKKLLINLKNHSHFMSVGDHDYIRIDSGTYGDFWESIEKVESLLDMKSAILKIAKNPNSIFEKGYISKQIQDVEDKIKEIIGE